jgi:hypothetical protein
MIYLPGSIVLLGNSGTKVMAAQVSNGVGVSKALERRREARFEGTVVGSFTIPEAAGVRVAPCAIVSISASAMRIGTDEVVGVGQAIWVDIDRFGPIRASVETVRHDGFICQNLLNEPARKRLGIWVAWLARRNGRVERDKRAFMRSRPHDSRTTIAFEDGEMIAVELKDVSRSGAAVVSDFVPEAGTPVMVGKVLGRVSRIFTGGFAVEFDRVLEGADADRLVSGFQIKALPLSSTG